MAGSERRRSDRHSWVSLSGNHGTLIGGRIDRLRYGSLFGKFDPFHGLPLDNFGQMAPMIGCYDNSVMYISPAFRGPTAKLAFSPQVKGQEGATPVAGDSDGGNAGDNRTVAALLYSRGPLSLGASYESYHTQGLDQSRFCYATLGGAYDLGIASPPSPSPDRRRPGECRHPWPAVRTPPPRAGPVRVNCHDRRPTRHNI